MKKKYFLLFVLAITCLLLTGCGTKIKNDKAMFKYLKNKYPKEEFEIIKYYETDPKDNEYYDPVNECDYEGPEKHYIVKSKETGISFVVEDSCGGSPSLWLYYEINDEYFKSALYDLEHNTPNTKIYIREVSYYDRQIMFKAENYTTKEEMVEDICIILEKLNNYPFKYQKIRDNLSIGIGDKNSNNSYEIDEIKNKRTVQEIVDEIYQ